MKTKKKTVAKADANARAKELKRARDARYRAMKKAQAQAQKKAQAKTEKPKTDANAKLVAENNALHEVVAALGLAVLSSELVLMIVSCRKGVPADIRKMASRTIGVGKSAFEKLRAITEGK